MTDVITHNKEAETKYSHVNQAMGPHTWHHWLLLMSYMTRYILHSQPFSLDNKTHEQTALKTDNGSQPFSTTTLNIFTIILSTVNLQKLALFTSNQ